MTDKCEGEECETVETIETIESCSIDNDIVLITSCIQVVMKWCTHYINNVLRNIPLTDNSKYAITIDIDDTIYYQCQCLHPSPPPELFDFFEYVQQTGISIYFISAKQNNALNMKHTTQLLHLMGFKNYQGLYLMPQTHSNNTSKRLTPSLFKFQVRQQLNKLILLNIGNNWYDLMLLEPHSTDEVAHIKRAQWLKSPYQSCFVVAKYPDVAVVGVKFPTVGCTKWA